MNSIKFGTDGWRGIIAEDFTFANARVVAQGYRALRRAMRRCAQGCHSSATTIAVRLGRDRRCCCPRVVGPGSGHARFFDGQALSHPGGFLARAATQGGLVA